MEPQTPTDTLLDNLKDGQVEEFAWGSATGSQVSINASGVRQAITYYGQYTFDGVTLHVTAPTTTVLPPSAETPIDPSAPSIQNLDIDTWGNSPLTPPLQFAGPVSGTITFAFRRRTGVSGPIGSATGP